VGSTLFHSFAKPQLKTVVSWAHCIPAHS
jgi:hypothetical protein